MIKPLKTVLDSPLWTLCRSSRVSLVYFAAMFACNLVAALLEGVSFASFFFALSFADSQNVDFPTFFPEKLNWIQHLPSFQGFLFFLAAAVLVQVLKSAFTFVAQCISTKLSNELRLLAQMRIYEQIFRFSFQFANSYRTGDLADYATSPQTLFNSLIECINRVLIGGLGALTLLCILFKLSASLTLVFLVSATLLYLFQKKLLAQIATYSDQASNAQAEVSKIAIQTFSAIRTVFTFGLQDLIFSKVSNKLKEHAQHCNQVYLRGSLLTNLNELLGVLLIGICLIGGHLFLNADNTNTVPLLLTFIGIAYRLTTRLQIVFQHALVVTQQWGSHLRLNKILSDRGKEFAPKEGICFSGLKQEIAFQNISFSYLKNRSQPILRQISFTIPKGHTIAFVGSSGAGKSTITDLLVRLYDPQEGAIYIDGIDLRTYDPYSWRQHLGVVNQEPFIFSDSILDNIRFRDDLHSAETAIQAAKIAGAHHFISRLPDGYLTEVGERGYRLSTGEKQRIALARALIHNPEILILDEATSNLDSHSEKKIQLALSKFSHSKTIIVVAHRLSTIKDADQIYVVDDGCILEKGTHNELLAKQGKYASLWNVQVAHQEIAFHST